MEPSPAFVEGLAGALGGVLGLAATYPLLTVATRLQLQERGRKKDAACAADAACAVQASADGGNPEQVQTPTDAAAPAREKSRTSLDGWLTALADRFPAAPTGPPPLPPTLLGALLQLALAEGRAGLFAGLRPACASLFAGNLLFYAFYAALRDAALRRSGRRHLGGAAALPISAAAGALNVLLTNPAWVLVTRLQANAAAGRRSAAEEALALYRSGGLGAFWAGAGPSLVMVSNPVIQFAVYEWLAARGGGGGGGGAATFARAAAAKLAATLVTYPYLVIKSRQQAGGRAAVAAAGGPQRGPLAELLFLARAEGLGGLYAGLDSKLLQTVLAAAILFSSKESMTGISRHLLRRRRR
jgi:adenine nucleotide transporter 17